MMQAFNETKSIWLATKLECADTFLRRCRGLLGRTGLADNQGLWIRPCDGIHTFFMRFPIDVVFLDRSRKTVKVVERLRSGRVVLPVSQATSVLELPAGTINRTGTSLGDLISITEADTDGSGSVRSGQDTGGPVNIPATVSGPPISGGEL